MEDKKENKKKHDKKTEALIEENTLLNEKVLRLLAETQNIKKRYDEETSRILKYEGKDIFLSILPIVDNFERAIAMDKTEDDKFLEGFRLIYANLINMLESFEVKEIDCLNKDFDPNTMQAVLTDDIETEEHNIVLEILQKGYMYKDKLLRPAMVKVNN